MSRYATVTIEDEVALVTLGAPQEKVNVLNGAFLQELDEIAGGLASRTDLAAAVVISSKAGGFIAGADIGEISKVDDADCGTELARRGQQIFARWAALPIPVVAAIHGHCMGGGTEFALACGFRVAAQTAAIALPEIKLGILPGFGGTQRLPRLVPLETALEMILTGKTVRAKRALSSGLVDRVVSPEGLKQDAIALARQAAADPAPLLAARKRKLNGWRQLLLEKNPLGRALLFSQASQRARKTTGGHYPAPPKALEVIRQGLSLPLDRGLEIEAIALGELVVTPECKNLVHVFYLSQRGKKGAGVEAEPLPVKRAAVLGAGVMGGTISWLLADKGIPTVLKDIAPKAVDAGLDHARDLFCKGLKKRGLGEEALPEKMKKLAGTTDYEQLAEPDLVIEAVVEKMAVKQAVLAEVEPLLAPQGVFATNTSALSVSELQAVAQHPERVGGMHFFNPVNRMPLVEIIRGDQTSDQTVATLFETATRLGKTPITVSDRPGFLVNRLLMAYLNEACLAAGEAVEWRSLDRLATRFGLPMGPFRLLDEVGLDIGAEVGKTIATAFPYLPESPILSRMAAQGWKGKKGGKGFYCYPAKGEPVPNPELGKVLAKSYAREATEADLRRLLLMMVNEAGRCLNEGIVAEAADIDTGMVFGTGFPPFRGGLCRWADEEGLAKLVRELLHLADRHGSRFAPCDYLNSHTRFYR